MDKKENNNKFNDYKIIILMIFIVLVICVNFFSIQKFKITAEIIICLLILVILALAELFDNLSIPKIISLSKNIKDVKKENSELKETNTKLLEQIVSIRNSNNQNLFFPGSFSTESSPTIESITNKDEQEIQEESDSHIQNNTVINKLDFSERRKYRNVLEIFTLKKALNNNSSDEESIRYDVKLINNNISDNNIMKDEIRFDAIKTDNEKDIFYEVKYSTFILDYSYELYYMLRTLELYRETTNKYNKLVLVIPHVDEELNDIIYNSRRDRSALIKERISKKFATSIKNQSLEILEVEITKEELDDYIEKQELNKKNK